jgi:molybdopterin-dependent oxidoreductase alpha subunit
MVAGGGLKAILYSLKASYKVGFLKMHQASISKNTCKTCALGMGGQKGGMVTEDGNSPEVCKKSFQAQITDIQSAIPEMRFKENSIEDFKNTPARLLEQIGRLNSPIYKEPNSSHYSPISWDQAIEKIVNRLKTTIPDRSFFYSSGRSSNEAGFLLQLFARIYGTNNVNNCAYYCHQASSVGISSVIGTATATVELEDLNKADLVFVIGCNPASNHPRFVRYLINCRRRGGHVIVINPAKEPGLVKFAIPSDFKSMISGGSRVASEYLQNHIGSDIALLKGIAKVVIENGKHDSSFIESFTNGSEDYIDDVKNTSWDLIVTQTGISKDQIQKIADIYSNSKNVIFSWAMGITHHENGVENVESIVNLALLRGMIGKRNAGLLPLRGHSNIQGIGSVGVNPILKPIIRDNIEKRFDIKLPTSSGMDTMSCMKASYNGKIDTAFILGGNLFDANPDSQFTEKALNNIPFKVFMNTTLNRGHFYGVDQEVLILPVTARDEELQKTTQESMFNYVRLSDGGIVRLDNVRTEIDIIADIAQKVAGDSPVNFKELSNHQKLREVISETIPGFEKMNSIDDSCEEFQISGRVFHKPEFATPDKKANFRICPIREINNKNDEYRMMTIRSEGQFNSIIYEEADIYRGQKSRWIVLMNRDDIKNAGLHINDKVTLESSTGKMEKVVVREFDIPSGNIMTYYPESNVLVPTTVDPRSQTPAYKLAWVRIF